MASFNKSSICKILTVWTHACDTAVACQRHRVQLHVTTKPFCLPAAAKHSKSELLWP